MSKSLHDVVCPSCGAAFKTNVKENGCFYCGTRSITHPHHVPVLVSGKLTTLVFCSDTCADNAFHEHIHSAPDGQKPWEYQKTGDPIKLTEEQLHALSQ